MNEVQLLFTKKTTAIFVNILIKLKYMFGSRFIVNMACKSVYRSTFKVSQSFATMSPIYTYKIY